MPTNKLSKIIKALTPDETDADFKELDAQIGQLKDKLKEKVQVKTLDQVNIELEKFRRRISLDPLIQAVKNIESSLSSKYDELVSQIDEKNGEISKAIASKSSTEKVSQLRTEIDDLNIQLSTLEETRKSDIDKIKKSIPDLTDLEDRLGELTTKLSARIDVLEEEEPQEIKDWQDTIDRLRIELINRINSIGGGSMNRQITVGNTDPLTKYTDINLKAGSNVTITTANNNATRRVDITIASSGGGGGSTRSINSISTSQTAGSASGTDYVYLCSGTMTLTMPDATAGNTNLYTVKNVGTGIITINCTGGQTIDNDPTVIMPVRYTSVDLISDTANWDIT